MSIDYAIEWAYGEFRIARFKNSEIAESWKSPKPVTDLASLSEAMYDAAHHVDLSRGGSVAIAYEDDFHTHEFLEVPELSKKDMGKFLERRVAQDKPFQGEACWRHHPVSKGTNLNGVLLHLMPKYIVDTVIRICEEFYLMPKLMVPLTEIMSEYVPSLEIDENEAALMIALFDDRTQLVVSSDCGEILFVRELSYPWSHENSTRLTRDINRTIGYSKQRIENELTSGWILGENAEAAIADISQGLDVEVSYDATAARAEFWMLQVAQLPQSLESNFIPMLARQSITGKTLMRLGVVSTAVTLAVALLFSLTIEILLYQQETNPNLLAAEIIDLYDEVEQLNAEVDLITVERAKLDALSVDAFNLPAIFMSHLGEILPDELMLVQAEVSDQDDIWEVNLTGVSALPLSETAPLLAQLEDTLSTDPWNTEITQSWESSWMQQLEAGSAIQDGQIGFEIRGQFR